MPERERERESPSSPLLWHCHHNHNRKWDEWDEADDANAAAAAADDDDASGADDDDVNNTDDADDADADAYMLMMTDADDDAATWYPGAASGLTAASFSPANAQLLRPAPCQYHHHHHQ